LTFTAARQILVSDIDDLDAVPSPAQGDENVQITLSAAHGTLTLSTISGLTFNFSDANGVRTGDGTADATLVFLGRISAVNAAMFSLVYLGNQDFNGAETITITTNDLGNFGTGGPKTDTDTIGVTVNPINDGPTFTLGSSPTSNEDAGPQTVNG